MHPNGLEENKFGRYTINTNPSNLSSGWCNMGDHTANGTQIFITDCSLDNTKRMWYENVTVSQNTTYYFSGFAYAISEPSPCYFTACGNPILQVKINGTTIIDNLTITYQNCNNGWVFFQASWNSGSSTNALIEIRSLSAARNGNDLALDDLTFTTNCPVTVDEVNITVGSNTPTISPAGPITYYNQYETNQQVVLTSSLSPSYQWYKNGVAISGATSQSYTINCIGMGSYTDIYTVTTSCGTSNAVTFNYIGCDEVSDYPVTVQNNYDCSSFPTQLAAPNLGTGTSSNWWLHNNPSCLSINSSGQLSGSSGCWETSGVYTKSSIPNGTETYMYHVINVHNCHVGIDKNGKDEKLATLKTSLTPNPSKNQITITSAKPIKFVEIYSFSGTLLKKVKSNESSTLSISVKDLANGIYLSKIYNESATEVIRFVISQ